MSNKMLNLVWDKSQAEGTDLLMMIAIADQANDDGECWPAVGTLAQKTRLKTIRGTQKALKRLVVLGELSIEARRIDYAKNKTNVYVINIKKLKQNSEPLAPKREREAGGVGVPQDSQWVSPRTPEPLQHQDAQRGPGWRFYTDEEKARGGKV